MGGFKPNDGAMMNVKPKNKMRRQAMNERRKKEQESAKRDLRFSRRREEAKNPGQREARLATNVPQTIESKRQWDTGVGDEEDVLGFSVDVERLAKRRKMEEEEAAKGHEEEEEGVLAKLKRAEESEVDWDEEDSDMDSMLDSGSDDGSDSDSDTSSKPTRKAPPKRELSPAAASTATNLELTPDFLKQKFPGLFAPCETPKILITTSLGSILHEQAHVLESIFPNSTYIRRSAHHHSHKYSVREIAKFATNREYTTLIVLMEDKKKPAGLDVIHLPSGPHFHFSITNWIDSKKLVGHGNSTGHRPELILNNFVTPLGMLTAHLFKSLYPAAPELEGRTVVTLHNQRDYIFFRMHRYVFREKKATEKSIVGTDGKVTKGVEDLRAGLQELGPRMTLKLRRIDRGVQWASGQEWEWKAGMEKQRTRFNM